MQDKAPQKLQCSEDLYSTCPAGEAFLIPGKADHDAEFVRLNKIVEEQRRLGT